MADLIIDQWSGFDHKDKSKIEDSLPGWYDDQTKRRVGSYRVCDAYAGTVARELLPANAEHGPDELQEYGDSGVLIDRVASSVLGTDPLISVVGADAQVPDLPDLPDKPQEPATDGVDPRIAAVESRVYDTAIQRWVEEAETLTDAWEELVATTPVLSTRQDWIQDWADQERLIGRLQENEVENIVALGDGVIVLGWDAAHQRVKTEIFDPDTYVPEIDNSHPSEFPERVHLVWPFPDNSTGTEVKKVRRITYELVPVEEVEGFTPAAYLRDGQDQTHVCLHTDATWLESDFDDMYNPTKPPESYEPLGVGVEGELIELNRYNTTYDFIPVIHVPNTLSTKHHFGRSLLARLGQLLDEIAATDTDSSLCSRWAAQPPMVIKGLAAGVDTVDMTAGKGISGDKVETVDLAQNLEKIEDRGQGLQKRLSISSQVPDGLRGRVDASEVPSGLALTLSFTPFVQLIARYRQTRAAKYPLLLKFVQRIAIQNIEESGIDSDEVHEAEIRFGAFMPQDLLGAAEVIARLYTAKLISLETALLELQEAGLGIEDLAAEVAKIRAADGEGALAIADATNSNQAALDYLGLDQAPVADGVDPDGTVVNPEGALAGVG